MFISYQSTYVIIVALIIAAMGTDCYKLDTRDKFNAEVAKPSNVEMPTFCATRTCRPPFVMLECSCWLFEMSQQMNYEDARTYCLERGSDLAMVKTGNEMVAVLQYLKGINSAREEINAWLGATNLEDGTWKWNDGSLMPRGSPFWGTVENYQMEPVEENQHYAFLYEKNGYVFHNIDPERIQTAPLCQYNP